MLDSILLKTGVFRITETMLRWGSRQRGGKEGENYHFKDSRGRAKKRDEAVGGRNRGGFSWFRDGKHKGLFPDKREVRGFEGEVNERSKVGDGASTKVLQVDHRHVIWTDGSQRFGPLDGVDGVIVGERSVSKIETV